MATRLYKKFFQMDSFDITQITEGKVIWAIKLLQLATKSDLNQC